MDARPSESGVPPPARRLLLALAAGRWMRAAAFALVAAAGAATAPLALSGHNSFFPWGRGTADNPAVWRWR